MGEQETVDLVVKVPKGIVDFFNAFLTFIGEQKYTAETWLAEHCLTEIKNFMFDFIEEVCDNTFWNGKYEVVIKYRLAPHIDLKALGFEDSQIKTIEAVYSS